MINKKVLIIGGSIIGFIGIAYISYRIASRWNKTVLKEDGATILVSNTNPTDVEVVNYGEESNRNQNGDTSELGDLSDLSDAEFNCYVYNDCAELDAEYYSSLTEDDTKPNE